MTPAARAAHLATIGLGFTQIVGWGTTFLMPAVLGRHMGEALGLASEVVTVDILPEGSPAANPAFDVTPARLVTALITERGVCPASEAGLLSLYPGQTRAA